MKNKLLLALAVLVIAVVLPELLRLRDEAAFRVLVPLKTLSNAVRQGWVSVIHDQMTLDRVRDARGPISAGRVHLFYISDFDEAKCASHAVLIHATGGNAGMFFEKVVDNPLLASSEGFEELSVADRFHAAGHCVTAFDMRGHGRSDVTLGPYTVELLAADIHGAAVALFGESAQFHLVGHSLGFGASLSLALNYPKNVLTVSGSGFLSDRTSVDIGAWLASRTWLVRTMGLAVIGRIGSEVIQCDPPGLLPKLLQHMHVDGYLHAAAAWLNYNEQHRIHEMAVPALYLYPPLESRCGYTLAMFEKEVSLLPVAKLVKFESGSHCMNFFRPAEYYAPVFDWMARARTTVSSNPSV